jgi:hypothetical protein
VADWRSRQLEWASRGGNRELGHTVFVAVVGISLLRWGRSRLNANQLGGGPSLSASGAIVAQSNQIS